MPEKPMGLEKRMYMHNALTSLPAIDFGSVATQSLPVVCVSADTDEIDTSMLSSCFDDAEQLHLQEQRHNALQGGTPFWLPATGPDKEGMHVQARASLLVEEQQQDHGNVLQQVCG
jgi:hypothetical protein